MASIYALHTQTATLSQGHKGPMRARAMQRLWGVGTKAEAPKQVMQSGSNSVFSLAVVACGVVRKGLRPISAGAERVSVSIRPTPTRRAARKWMLAYRARGTPLDTLTLPHGSAQDPIHAGPAQRVRVYPAGQTLTNVPDALVAIGCPPPVFRTFI